MKAVAARGTIASATIPGHSDIAGSAIGEFLILATRGVMACSGAILGRIPAKVIWLDGERLGAMLAYFTAFDFAA